MANKLPRNAKLILSDLCRARRPLPVRQIATRNNVTWKTANANIKKLENKNLVQCNRDSKNRTFCEPTNKVKKVFKEISKKQN
jgi:DNA-binding MarR family transcriptional regulator